MEVLNDDQLAAVSGGMVWGAVFTFLVSELDHVRDMINGAVDGFMDGMQGKPYDPDSVYTGP